MLGHIKPLLALFMHMAERRSAESLTFTLLTSAPMLPKINRELELMAGHLSERIKYACLASFLDLWTLIMRNSIIDVGAPESPFVPMAGLMSVFEALWSQTPVVCKTTKKSFELPRPTVAIIDVCIFHPFLTSDTRRD
jgi:hypothetical protein